MRMAAEDTRLSRAFVALWLDEACAHRSRLVAGFDDPSGPC
jgi:hypothetical protein